MVPSFSSLPFAGWTDAAGFEAVWDIQTCSAHLVGTRGEPSFDCRKTGLASGRTPRRSGSRPPRRSRAASAAVGISFPPWPTPASSRRGGAAPTRHGGGAAPARCQQGAAPADALLPPDTEEDAPTRCRGGAALTRSTSRRSSSRSTPTRSSSLSTKAALPRGLRGSHAARAAPPLLRPPRYPPLLRCRTAAASSCVIPCTCALLFCEVSAVENTRTARSRKKRRTDRPTRRGG